MKVGLRTDVPQAAAMARRFAERCGFDEKSQWEVATIAAELASNIVKHAGKGTISLDFEPQSGGRGVLHVVAEDRGTFIGDPGLALTDRYSRGHQFRPDPNLRFLPPDSLGSGLGAIKRLSDRMAILFPDGGGTRVEADKVLAPRKTRP